LVVGNVTARTTGGENTIEINQSIKKANLLKKKVTRGQSSKRKGKKILSPVKVGRSNKGERFSGTWGRDKPELGLSMGPETKDRTGNRRLPLGAGHPAIHPGVGGLALKSLEKESGQEKTSAQQYALGKRHGRKGNLFGQKKKKKKGGTDGAPHHYSKSCGNSGVWNLISAIERGEKGGDTRKGPKETMRGESTTHECLRNLEEISLKAQIAQKNIGGKQG